MSNFNHNTCTPQELEVQLMVSAVLLDDHLTLTQMKGELQPLLQGDGYARAYYNHLRLQWGLAYPTALEIAHPEEIEDLLYIFGE